MIRRSFLKWISLTPLAVFLPKIKAKPEFKPNKAQELIANNLYASSDGSERGSVPFGTRSSDGTSMYMRFVGSESSDKATVLVYGVKADGTVMKIGRFPDSRLC